MMEEMFKYSDCNVTVVISYRYGIGTYEYTVEGSITASGVHKTFQEAYHTAMKVAGRR